LSFQLLQSHHRREWSDTVNFTQPRQVAAQKCADIAYGLSHGGYISTKPQETMNHTVVTLQFGLL
jgi:hypothetical protein